MREILHIDMDAFYASVEIADQPFLAGKPVIVGGYKVVEPTAGGGERVSGRGVVCAASYEARRFGVRSAMPMAEAIRRCPQAILLPVRMRRYAEVSSKVFEIFHRFTPLVQGLSLDEAFLDVTGSRALFGDGVAIAHQIRSAIREELGLVASAGVAPTKFVAKIASDLEKPNALVDFRENVKERLAPLPTTRLWGVGGKSLPRLEALGLRTFGDFQEAPDEWLRKTVGEVGVHYKLLASGIDGRPVVPEREAKSIGSETTYEEDLRGREDVARALLEHSETVAARLVRNGLAGRTLAIKLKTDRFEIISRQTPLGEPALSEELAIQMHDAGISVHAMHPGWVETPGVASALPVFRAVVGPLLRTPAEGADTIVWLLATADSEVTGTSGKFWLDRRARTTHRLAKTRRSDTPAERKALLGWLEEVTAPYGPVGAIEMLPAP
jgi:DNA polymerase-4